MASRHLGGDLETDDESKRSNKYKRRHFIVRLIPGWDSIAGAQFWSSFHFWASIGALILLGVFEVLSHRYGERKDELVAIDEEATKQAHDNEIAKLHKEAADASERASKANERAMQLEKDAATIRERAALTEERLLGERRLTARERWRLERVERIVLPRSIDAEAVPRLVQALKDAKLKPICLAISKDREATTYGLAFVSVLKDAGLLANTFVLPENSIAPSLIVVGIDDDVNTLADLLFQKFQIGQGWRQRNPKGMDPASANMALAGVPGDRTCLVVGSNRDAALQGAEGQPGEGLDKQGEPVPAPR